MMKKLISRIAAVCAAVCMLCTASPLQCFAAYRYGEFPNNLKPVPNWDFWGITRGNGEVYYSGEPLSADGKPQNGNFFYVWEVSCPMIWLETEGAENEALVEAITDVFQEIEESDYRKTQTARFRYQFLEGGLSIYDTKRNIRGMEEYADRLYEAIKDRFTLTEYLYLSKSGSLNAVPRFGSYWWVYDTNGMEQEEIAEFLANAGTKITDFLAAEYPDWHTEITISEDYVSGAVAVLPNDDIAADVTFEQYTAVLSAVTHATGYYVCIAWNGLGNNFVQADDLRYYGQTIRRGETHSDNYLKRYLSTGRIRSDGFPSFDFYDFARQIAEIPPEVSYEDPQYGGTYIPVRPTEDRDTRQLVNYWDWASYQGILVWCEDGESLFGSKLGNFPILRINEKSDIPAVWIHGYTATMESLNMNDALGGDYSITAAVPEPYASHPENLWVLTFDMRYVLSLFDALCEDDRIHPLGILKTHVHIPACFGYGGNLHIEPAEGWTPETIDWESVSARVGTEIHMDAVYSERFGQTFYLYSASFLYNNTLEEAEQLCYALEECGEISFAWLEGTYPVSSESVTCSGGEIDLFRHFGTGDLNRNNDIDLVDAVLLARATGGIKELTVESRAEADLDASGSIDNVDLTLILRKLAGI